MIQQFRRPHGFQWPLQPLLLHFGSCCCGAAAVVDNLPVVPEDKHEKLANVLKKIYSQIGNIREGAHGVCARHSRQQLLVYSRTAGTKLGMAGSKPSFC